MSVGMIYITIGVLGLIINTIAVFSFYFQMKKQNELAFIVQRTTREPLTKILSKKDLDISLGKPNLLEDNGRGITRNDDFE